MVLPWSYSWNKFVVHLFLCVEQYSVGKLAPSLVLQAITRLRFLFCCMDSGPFMFSDSRIQPTELAEIDSHIMFFHDRLHMMNWPA